MNLYNPSLYQLFSKCVNKKYLGPICPGVIAECCDNGNCFNGMCYCHKGYIGMDCCETGFTGFTGAFGAGT
jgi:hypothetical protein